MVSPVISGFSRYVRSNIYAANTAQIQNPLFFHSLPISTVITANGIHAGANRLGLRMMDGVYAYNSGPAYETPAEIQAYKAQGADVVGMSTVPEAVVAKACGMKLAGVSLVANLAAGIARTPLSHADVIAAAESAKPRMAELVDDFVLRL